MEDMLEYLKNHKIRLEDSFSFSCNICGKCCKEREDILLSAYDLFRIAKFLKKEIQFLLEKYCEVYIGPDSKIPLCRLYPIGKEHACPFLKGKRCSIQEVKPTVCALFPLGRYYEFSFPKQASYFLQDTFCGGKEKVQTVREWLASFDLLEEEVGEIWSGILQQCSQFMIEQKEEEKKIFYQKIIFVLLYLNYKTEKPFLEQLKENEKILKRYIENKNGTK